MSAPLRVLIIEDSEDDAELLQLAVKQIGSQVLARRVETAAELQDALHQEWDIVLSDYNLPNFSAAAALEIVRQAGSDLPFIVVSGTVGEEYAVAAMRTGVNDYLCKNNLARLAPAVERELRQADERRARRKAEQYVRRLAAVVQAAGDAIISENPAGIITSWNPAAERLFGWSATEAIGKPISILFPPQLNGEHLDMMGRVRRGERIVNHETMRVCKDGRRVDVAITAAPILDETGNFLGTATSARDITEHKRVAEANERAALLLANVRDAIIVKNRDGIVTYWNAGATRLFGWQAEEMIGRPITDRVPSQARHQLVDRLRQLRAGSDVAGHWHDYRKDGSRVWVDARISAIRDHDGNEIGFVSISHDISDRVRTEAERDKILAQLQLLFERMPIACVLVDRECRYLDWNPAAEATFGYCKNEVLGKSAFELSVPANIDQHVRAKFAGMLRTGTAADSAVECRTKDGRTVFCEWYTTPLFAADGSVECVYSMGIDVTARRQLEDQMRQAQKMEAIGQLAGGVAHDFNNLLTVINGYTAILLERFMHDHDTHGLLAEVHRAGEHSAALTRQLLAFSRRQMVAPKMLDLNKVVAEAEKMLRRIIGEDIRFVLKLESELGIVRADPGQIEQVLLNLTINARDAMPKGGELTITTRNVQLRPGQFDLKLGAGPHVMLAVSDTGYGMTPEIQARIFEPFFTTKETGKGSGLGLATVYGIVKQNDGQIEVESTPNSGSTFRVYLPRRDAASDLQLPANIAAVPPPGNETLLLVEDEGGVRRLLGHVLTNCGYTVLQAGNADEALRVIGQYDGRLDLLITDVVMPGLSGRELAEQLLSIHPTLRVLFVSGYTDDAMVRYGVMHQEVDFLQKPFSPFVLAAKVRDILDARR